MCIGFHYLLLTSENLQSKYLLREKVSVPVPLAPQLFYVCWEPSMLAHSLYRTLWFPIEFSCSMLRTLASQTHLYLYVYGLVVA